MPGLRTDQAAALGSLRSALLLRARAQADDIRGRAEADCLAIVDSARLRAEALLAGARSQGRADAAAQAVYERARARRAAQAVVLRARREVYHQLRTEAAAAVSVLLSDPACHAALLDALRRQLGEQAVVHDRPDGGATAEGPGGRRIDASVESLVDAAASTLDLEPLWRT